MSADIKWVKVGCDWLEEIDGLTVADAIEFLKRLPQDHKVSADLEGDTHGAHMEVYLLKPVPMTQDEIFARRLKVLRDKERNQARALDFYKNHHSPSAPASVEQAMTNLANTQQQIYELHREFGKEYSEKW